MSQGDSVDRLIRSALQTGVHTEEPSAAVRDALLASAAHTAAPRSTLGPSIPAIVDDLQESDKQAAELAALVVTTIPLTRRHLLLLAAPLYAVR